MKAYEVISIEPTYLGKLWVVTYKKANGETDIETVEALDSNEAFIVFRNLMIKEAKAKTILRPKRK
jgi:hypothetical protein